MRELHVKVGDVRRHVRKRGTHVGGVAWGRVGRAVPVDNSNLDPKVG